jgi:hypothetical protein
MVVVAILATGAGACTGAASRGVSFETLGVPRATTTPGRSAIVVGWESEAREGWVISTVRIEGVDRAEWNAATQRPTVIAVEPGSHPLQVVAELHPAGGGNIRRLRLAPVQVQVGEAEAMLCEVRVVTRDDGRQRPRVRCEVLASAAGEPGDARDELLENPYRLWSDDGAGSPQATPARVEAPPGAPPTAAQPAATGAELLSSPYRGTPDDLADRVRLLELRLDRLERAIRDLARTQRADEADGAQP